MRRYIAFDIEIAKVLPEWADDWGPYRPLGISCAATLTSDEELLLWHGKTPDREIADQMSRDEIIRLVEHLLSAYESGQTILTWNGLGFDFDILAEESGSYSTCKELALSHVDMMFHLFCEKGFRLSLDKAAKGMGLPGKLVGMTGNLAPVYWAQGRRQEVLDYVAQDVRTTLGLAQVTEKAGQLRWISDRGKPQSLPLSKGWLTVSEAIASPEPDTSWMTKPQSRTRFTSWLRR